MTQPASLSSAAADRLVLLSLVRGFVDRPDLVELEHWIGPAMGGKAEGSWLMRCHGSDMGKIIGNAATHIKALQHIWRKIGQVHGLRYLLELEEPQDQGQAVVVRPKPASIFNGHAVQSAIVGVLEALGVDHFRVGIATLPPSPDDPWIFVKMTIEVKSLEDHELLTQRDSRGLFLMGSLGTVCRAWAAKAGVKMAVEVKRV